jgi:hypothetical protein
MKSCIFEGELGRIKEHLGDFIVLEKEVKMRKKF